MWPYILFASVIVKYTTCWENIGLSTIHISKLYFPGGEGCIHIIYFNQNMYICHFFTNTAIRDKVCM